MRIPFIEYYMLSPDPYDKTRHSGTDQSQADLADVNMKHYFPEISKEEYMKYINNNQVFNDMLNLVKNAFKRWYDFECEDICLNNMYQMDLNSYIYNDRINPTFIHVDQLLESIILSFMFAMLKWAKESESGTDDNCYFIYLLFVMNELCILGKMPAEDAKAAILEKVADDLQIMNLASDCHWAVMVFTVAHEIAHAYQTHTDPSYWDKHPKEAEFDADAVAYDILLRLIMDKREAFPLLENYAYLAPMMYMDFFNLYYYTDYILYGTIYCSQTHPTPEKRKEALFNVVEQEKYQLDTEEGNGVYQWFCQVYDLFVKKLPQYKESGKLTGIIQDELRK